VGLDASCRPYGPSVWTLPLGQSESGGTRVTAVIRRFAAAVQHNAQKIAPTKFLQRRLNEVVGCLTGADYHDYSIAEVSNDSGVGHR